MISIRECISESDLLTAREQHISFISKEVKKRVDFYKNLFETIQLTHQGKIEDDDIENNIKKIKLHHSQYDSFIKVIFKDNKSVDKKYKKLKNKSLFREELKDFKKVLKILNDLHTNCRRILGLDLSSNEEDIVLYKKYEEKYRNYKILLNKIFDYENWFQKITPEKEWGPYQLTKKLGIQVCCYCNRQYTFTLSKGVKKITRPELDHFLPKSKHPLLALNFFNLIPSCSVCNRDCKGTVDFSYEKYLSPYESNPKHQLIKYDYKPETYLGAIGKTDEIKVFTKINEENEDQRLQEKVKGNIKVFEYNKIANEHRDIVQEIIKKRCIFNDKYIETLQQAFPDIHLTLEEAYQLAYGNFYDEKEFTKRPLAKLTKDIAVATGVIKNKIS
ncbi:MULTISPECIES: HNH endonuclease [unclassified Apibacter]|uniref:HNH endonuclease n=1 Tax=unclassified Apibacter TaxID=2630820 RepID=UPI00135DB03F|nr:MULTISPECIES: hypothetical protein [unclassified Apibacter]MXP06437.1 hypothetical protein [Apibacter sp. B3546]MXP12662.1 hypothetical protein [Apibacter sp. B3239]